MLLFCLQIAVHESHFLPLLANQSIHLSVHDEQKQRQIHPPASGPFQDEPRLPEVPQIRRARVGSSGRGGDAPLFRESDDLNDAMLAEDTRYVEVNRYPQERETVALRVQHKINEERREENRELRERNRQLEGRARELEQENEDLRVELRVSEEQKNTIKKTYENVVGQLLKFAVEARGGKDDGLDEQLKVGRRLYSHKHIPEYYHDASPERHRSANIGHSSQRASLAAPSSSPA